ncbi:MAG: hypothetical protein HY905_11530 [Deltaproteobacteria bacterium]|nr:hypothetical protein [Deltaproteobacteria bacterium]
MRRHPIRRLAVLSAAFLGACSGGDDDSGRSDADASTETEGEPGADTFADAAPEVAPDASGEDGGNRGFGETCSVEEECESGVCFLFGDGSQLCTLECTVDDECPDGAEGRRCNRQGVCRP